MPNLTQEVISTFPIVYPSSRAKIAAILSAYDDLIEVNTRRIALLEEMARGLYREWFVYFRFPGHEGVRMVESAVGVVPEGWEVVKTGDAIDVNPPTKVPAEGVKPSVMMNGISPNTMLITEIGYRSVSSGSKFKNGDTLFARITPCLENGKTAFVQFLPTDDAVACGSTEFIVLRSRTLCPEFVYLLARSDAFRDNAIKSMTGASGRQRVQEACFDRFLFAHPDQKTLTAFARFVSPLFRMVQLLADKNANLRRTRDLLLPRLVAGEVGVHE
jgi:type I restriction enzyme S subunit